MIEKQFLQDYAIKNETTFQNTVREYLQHLFLTRFYLQPGSQSFLFKGGTALRLLFGSPRFSEDLDFSGINGSQDFERILEEVLLYFLNENINADLLESKPTSGGHLAVMEFALWQEKIEIEAEISFRSQAQIAREIIVVFPEIAPSYKVCALSRELLVREKIEALLARRKPRDYFDLYFILRRQELRQVLNLNVNQRALIAAELENRRVEQIVPELKRLLPKSFWSVLKDFPAMLKKELG